MNQSHDPNRTVDVPASEPADSLDAGLAAGFGRPMAPRSSMGDLRPVLLKDAEGESDHIVKPKSDAMPPKDLTGDRYRLDGEIARGGMGAVLRGRDVDLGRDLAVKVLLEKYADRPEVARRFIEEAQIGGQLQHPGVVPVYDIGRFGDRPFFTMKLVKGKTLAEVLAERKDLSSDRPRLLGIALQVSQTLAYAHAKSVIHRDLKPANIMVGAFGEVQVMDWGLAKVLASGGVADEEKASRLHQEAKDETHIKTARSAGSNGSFGTDTEAGSLLGTPAYMPPEQANGDVVLMDRRADVFGLGAILCEILTGKPPYVGRSQEEVRRKAANGDLADAYSRLAESGADKELNTLTRLCLSPEPMDRPTDAQAVAESLSGYLDGVQARLRQAELAEAAAMAKAIEETKRRKVTMALATLVVATIGLGGAGYLWYKADHDARMATLNREIRFALNQANTLREEAKTETTGNAARLSQAREKVQRALALVQTGQVDGELVRQVHSLKAELDDGEKDRKLLADLEEARLAQAGQGTEDVSLPNALPLFREAFEAYGLPIGKESPGVVVDQIRQKSPAIQEGILSALLEWKQIVETPNFHLEEPHLKWIASLIDDLEPKDGWRRKVWITAEEKDPAKRQEMLEKLAESMDEKNKSAAGLVFLAGQIKGPGRVKVLRKAQMLFPGDFWVNQNLGESLMVKPYSDPPDLRESIRFHTAAVALRPESPYALGSLSNALRSGKRNEEAIAIYQKALSLNPDHLVSHLNLGNAMKDKGFLDQAMLHYKKASSANQKPGLEYFLYWKIGQVYLKGNQYDLAIQNFQKSIELNPNFTLSQNDLGNAFYATGKVKEAFACQEKALKLDPRNVKALVNLGIILRGEKQLDQAIAKFREAIEIQPDFAIAHAELGNSLTQKGLGKEALQSYQKAIQLDAKLARTYSYLGFHHWNNGQVKEGISNMKIAIDLEPDNARFYSDVGVLFRANGQIDDAVAAFRQAIKLDNNLATAYLGLGAILCDVKKEYDEAIACFRKVIEINPKNADAYSNLSVALAGKGQMNEATNSIRKAVELAPDNLGARFNLACFAANEASSMDKISKEERTRLRTEARESILVALGQIKTILKDSTREKPPAVNVLKLMKTDPDLASIRDPESLKKLPPEEQKAFAQVWAEVDTLLKQANTPPGKENKP